MSNKRLLKYAQRCADKKGHKLVPATKGTDFYVFENNSDEPEYFNNAEEYLRYYELSDNEHNRKKMKRRYK